MKNRIADKEESLTRLNLFFEAQIRYIRIADKVQQIADRVVQNLEIISKNFQSSTRRTWICDSSLVPSLINCNTLTATHNVLVRKSHGLGALFWEP